MLAAILKETQITKLECAAARVFAFVSTPIDTPLSHHPHPTLLARSIGSNKIGDQSASALAAILKETQITNLRCASPQSVCFYANAR